VAALDRFPQAMAAPCNALAAGSWRGNGGADLMHEVW